LREKLTVRLKRRRRWCLDRNLNGEDAGDRWEVKWLQIVIGKRTWEKNENEESARKSMGLDYLEVSGFIKVRPVNWVWANLSTPFHSFSHPPFKQITQLIFKITITLWLGIP
jgi:hypothetical protein